MKRGSDRFRTRFAQDENVGHPLRVRRRANEIDPFPARGFFSVADYGLEADLFVAVPELVKALS